MKQIMILIFLLLEHCLLFSHDGSFIVKERNISFTMPDLHLHLDNVKNYKKEKSTNDTAHKAGIAFTAIGASLSAIAIPSTVLTALLIADVFHNTFILLGYSFCSWMSYLSLLYGAILLTVGIYTLSKSDIGLYWKYTVTKVIRNIGIVLTATSVLPLAGLIAACVYYNSLNISHNYFSWLDPAVSFIILGGVAFGQLIAGIVLTAVGSRLLYRGVGLAKLSPDLAITHDDKKSLNEGYAVSVGMRVRI